jgi:hypothetical protein
MPRYLALYTSPPGTPSTPPSAEHMAQMGRYMTESMQAGKLVSTGGVKKRETDAVSVRLEGGKYSVDLKPQAEWMRASGWAILQAPNKEQVIEDVKEFLQMVGGGVSEVIELFDPSMS